MKYHGHRGPAPTPREEHGLTPEQRASEFRRALLWRQIWRAEMEARKAASDPAARPPQDQSGTNRARPCSYAFAGQIARAEFRQFYWDAKKQPGNGVTPPKTKAKAKAKTNAKPMSKKDVKKGNKAVPATIS